MSDLSGRIDTLVNWMAQAKYLVIFTGAGISTESGLPDFRGPDGLWTRQARGLPPPAGVDWTQVEPNQAHLAVAELQNMGILKFLITQNVDNLHLRSGIKTEMIAEFHGNITKLRCTSCAEQVDAFPDLLNARCPICEKGKLVSSVVNFGDPIPRRAYQDSERHSRLCDLFIVAGSSLVVQPAASMPEIAHEAGAKLVIINQGETPLDNICDLRFRESTGEVLPEAVKRLYKAYAPID
ncbi:MAG: Sir2 family NAD-dependent protein deacetylase [Dehalococcoidia bacterium]